MRRACPAGWLLTSLTLACGTPAPRDAQVALRVVRGDADPLRDPGNAQRESSPVGSLEVKWLGGEELTEVVALGSAKQLSVRLKAAAGAEAQVALRGMRASDGAVYSGGRTPPFRAGVGQELEVPLFLGPLEQFTPVGPELPGPRLLASALPLGLGGALIVGGVERVAGAELPAEPYLVRYRLAQTAPCGFTDGCLTGATPPGRLGGIAVGLKDGAVLHGLGQLKGGAADASLYLTRPDGTTELLALGGEPLPALVGAAAVVLPDGAVLIAGGELAQVGSRAVFRVDTVSWGVSSQPSLGTARVHPGLAVLAKGQVLVAGGLPRLGSPALDSAELFEPGRGSQPVDGGAFPQVRKRLKGPRAKPTLVRLADDSVLVLGGGTDSPEVFQLSLGNLVGGFVDLVAPPPAKAELQFQAPAAVRLRRGEVLLAGGETAGSSRPFAAIFTPDANQVLSGDSPVYQGSYRAAGAAATLRGWPALVELADGSALLVGGVPSNPGAARLEVLVPDPAD